MGKPLEDYGKKRDFERTPEPPPAAPEERGGGAVFVVHRHDASRLHYDLRLEMNGVLCSWAIPKGFCYDPDEKRLALRTEDHPLEYEHFDGVIPKDQYGAGTMTIWDRGHYEVQQAEHASKAVEVGELKVILYGRKLRGEWHLVKTKQAHNTWLIFKSRDRYAGSQRDSALGIDLELAQTKPMPRSVKRMLVGERVEAFSDPAWLFEAEFEGRRVLVSKQGTEVRVRGLTKKLPGIEQELLKVRAQNALFDGVLVAMDRGERPSAERLEARLAGNEQGPVCFYAFDLLYYDEFDLRELPLVERKAALRAVLPPSPSVLFIDHVAGNGEQLVEASAAAGLGGVIAKKADGPYRAGTTNDWKRIPIEAAEENRELAVTEALARKRSTQLSSRVRCSNLEKVFWPAEGYTKGDLIAYYEGVTATLLPYLRERPIHMNRFPDGIEGKSFYQRQAKEGMPEWIPTEMIESETHEGAIPQMICNDRDTLLYLVNLGSIDLHPWLSRRGSLDSPDWAVIDLDPKQAPFSDVVRIAQVTGELLREIGLRPLLKTSGASGLHIYIPLIEGYDYEQARMFCEGVCRLVARVLPDISTVERVIGSREGKVYLDYGQNRRGQTVVPPYSVRPVRGASVSTPLEWAELDSELHPSRFTIQTVPTRFERYGDLFRPALEDRQDLLPAIEALQQRLQG